MELHEFVAQTLIQIIEGVATARSKKNEQVAPMLEMAKAGDRVYSVADSDRMAFLVEFDVAVTAVEKTSAQGGGGIQVLSLMTAKGEKSKTIENSIASRIRFDVPISYGPKD